MKLYNSDGSLDQRTQNTISRNILKCKCSFLLAAAVAVLISNGCAFLGLRQDLSIIEQTAEVSGKVLYPNESTSPIFVALYKNQGEKQVLHAYTVAYSSGGFRFHVSPGAYHLFAFEDKNEDAAFQPDERVDWYGDPSPLTLGPGDVSEEITLKLRTPAEAREILPQLYVPSIKTVPMVVQQRDLGTVVQLSDRRFGADYASKGLWEPVKFIEEPGSGLFFLEPYTEQKIPLLFVHGAGGFPQQWEPIIKSIDRSRFQPWILHYPSGFRLGLICDYLERYINELQMKHQFRQLFIVAHSMGGLVSRCALNRNLEKRHSVSIKLLVTISTPWKGQPAAGYGVKQSPLVIPSWYDMVPESPFLKRLHQTPLPSGLEYDLLFGYRGGSSLNDELNDGTVLLSSVLDNDMQEAASKVYGFNEGHVSILKSPALIKRLNQLLNKAARFERP